MAEQNRPEDQYRPVEQLDEFDDRPEEADDLTTGSEGSGRRIGLNPDRNARRGDVSAKPAHPEPQEPPRLIDSDE